MSGQHGEMGMGRGVTLDGLWVVGHGWAQLSVWVNGMQRVGGMYYGQVAYRSWVAHRGQVHGVQCGPVAHGGLGTWRVGGRVEGG